MSVKQTALLLLGIGLLPSFADEPAFAADRYVSRQTRPYNGPYEGTCLDQIAFPMGGIGAGMVCLEGSGCLSHLSIRHQPEIFNEPETFAAVYVKTARGARVARLLEGPAPGYKILRWSTEFRFLSRWP